MTAQIKTALRHLSLAPFAFRMRERLRGLERGKRPCPSPDGFPLPPAKLTVFVTGSSDSAWYIESGRLAAESICSTLGEAGIAPAEFRSILDFGCGCDRVIRYWPSLTSAELCGTDTNARLIEWCRRNLPFGKFQLNTLEPPLDYADQQFDFAYAVSVLTHTPEDLQQPWINELWRILRPGGYLLITTQGAEYVPKLTDSERDRYRQGHPVVRYEEAAATNLCSVYHPEQYVRERLAQKFSIIMSRSRGAAGNGNQDIYLLRRPP
ncbi:MAG: methylase involved in ubiquinone/menaquinone biosynthesis [Bryobacterales bacterium]|nr:methylase involved in ubiquinone/menaquinone biosynthesis [Bryobacterales bacterium]